MPGKRKRSNIEKSLDSTAYEKSKRHSDEVLQKLEEKALIDYDNCTHWCDGESDQLTAIFACLSFYRNVCFCKHCASRSALVQALDSCNSFKSIKTQIKKGTHASRPEIPEIIEDLRQGLQHHGIVIEAKHTKTLGDFLSRFPYILRQAFRQKILLDGWQRYFYFIAM